MPPEYGPPTTIYNRFNRWPQRGLWHRLFEKVAATGEVPQERSLDSSHVKAHRSRLVRQRAASQAAVMRVRIVLTADAGPELPNGVIASRLR